MNLNKLTPQLIMLTEVGFKRCPRRRFVINCDKTKPTVIFRLALKTFIIVTPYSGFKE